MADKPTPTDAELEALLLDKLPASKHYIRPVIEKMVAAMQAAIDKWGQPAQAAEPVAVVVPCYTPSGKRVALCSAKQDLPIGTKLYAAPQPSPTAQAAESVPAVEREQERIAFKDAHRHLELYEVPDAWGRPMFKHSHVEASWLGWIARASHGQAPAKPDPAYSAACNLATALFKKHFAHLPDFASGQAVWSLCDSTAGVISQIDNMVSGLVQPPTTAFSEDEL